MEKNKVFIFNLWHTMNNYGANLTAYALQEILKTLNYDPELVNNAFHKTERKNKSSNCSIQFWNKYLQTSKNFVNDVNALNNEADKFIVGSDQVFRPIYMGHKTREYLLDFVKPDSKKIALAASFGVDKNYFLEENPREQVEQMKKSLQSFDYVSVRENAGVEICCDIMGVEAEWIIDPVFILDKSYYEKLICNATEDYSDRIVSYVLDPNADYRQARKYLEKQYNTKVVELANSNTSVENWLSAIKNCKFLVTDSFHGACFAIMFNKPFIVCLANRGNATTRFESILSLLNIENKCINSYNEILQKDCLFSYDYEQVNRTIEREAQKGLKFLKNALETPVEVTEKKVNIRMEYLEFLVKKLQHQATLKYQIKRALWYKWLIISDYMPLFLQNFMVYIRNKFNG